MITQRFDSLVIDMANWALQLPLADAAAAAVAAAEWQGRQGQQQEEQQAGMVLLRFAAHMGLALRALGLVPDERAALAEGADIEQLRPLIK